MVRKYKCAFYAESSEGGLACEVADLDDIDAVGLDLYLGDSCGEVLSAYKLSEDGVYLDLHGFRGNYDYHSFRSAYFGIVVLGYSPGVGAFGAYLFPFSGSGETRRGGCAGDDDGGHQRQEAGVERIAKRYPHSLRL